ncbi:hypothetical protein AYI92_12365 [Shewanella xiamenensis]|uniref:DUF4238 domain-containing protein n=1 Tax=Shewanella xiamenensis TaxID=332186 RepID=UPI0011846B52|nr:DUF4238 domain-containing protein [Shewanella xiamenensis]MDI5877741.1 DUF4238 domain-containing protein [Shewanella xiamenensis]TVL18248.1 hypothetical protein AYI90_12810 [Shewanella xiamenensis]TVL18586.1 hypothetical protein AYI91_12425 [Shewanella xiamenensis]TVL25428.1 hypothetical protein AYI92_12365 [Shewanella xiamenensis]TVL31570.1 hypothetical protein AYI93_12965 [Shewanella xiamenensis]
MSGKRHHFVPRFLQSGFASHKNGNETFTWVYRKDLKIFNTNTINIGIEGLFYSLNGDEKLDNDITLAEEHYSAVVKELREATSFSVLNNKEIAELIAHLEVRTRYLRQSFCHSVNLLVDELLRFIEDKQAFGRYVQSKIFHDPKILHNAINDELKKRNVSAYAQEDIFNTIQNNLEKLLPDVFGSFPLITDEFRLAISEVIKSSAKSGHIKALQQMIAPSIKIDIYERLVYRVVNTQDIEVPLGDTMLVFQMEGDRPFKPFTDKNDQIQAVYLPLSSNCVLVGSINDTFPDISFLPTVIAQCSLEYFISMTNKTENSILQSRIGELAYILSQEQIKDLVDEVISEVPLF